MLNKRSRVFAGALMVLPEGFCVGKAANASTPAPKKAIAARNGKWIELTPESGSSCAASTR
jgi:hypothetical protein